MTALLLATMACSGGGTDLAADAGTRADAASGTVAEVASTTTGGVTRAGDELLPELAGMPLPEDASLRMGYASNGIVSQQVDTDLDLAAAEAFYRDRLPDAGFAITNEPATDASVPLRIVEFTTADGASGNITIQVGDAKATRVSISMIRQG